MNNKNIYSRESRLRNGSCNNISTKTANVSKKNSNKKRKFPEKEGSNIKHNNTDLMFQNKEYEEMNYEIEIDNNGDPNDIVLEYFDDQHHEEIKIETNEGEIQNDEINELAYDDVDDNLNYAAEYWYENECNQPDENGNEEADENDLKRLKNPIIQPICEGFDINEKIDFEISKVKEFKFPSDDIEPILHNSSITKGEFARELLFILHTHKCNNKVEKDILMLISKCFPNFKDHNLPISQREVIKRGIDGVEVVTTFYQSTVHKYIPPKQKTFCFDICSNGCSTYAGVNEDRFTCIKCLDSRFYPCKQRGCTGNDEDQCNHSIESRRAKKNLQYKPLLPLFIQLIKTKGFLDALYFINEDQEENILTDVLDGAEMKLHLHEMEMNGRAYQNKNSGERYVQVPLLLFLFYDGVKVFQTKSSVFWPLMLSILNLPPTFRSTVGAGMFMLALFTAIKDSAAEDFLFNDCLVPELERLMDGISLQIDGKFYFIQARLVMHVLDTPGMAAHIKMQGHMAEAPCSLCNCVHGVKRSGLEKVTFEGHRGMLDETHYLRFFGQSAICCPTDYYKDKKQFVALQGSEQIQAVIKSHKASDYNLKSLKCLAMCCDESNGVRNKILSTIVSEKYTWHHPNIDPNKLNNILFYHHFDFRSKIEYRRNTNEDYVNNALKVIHENEIRIVKNEEKMRNNKKFLKKDIEALAVNGVKGLWAFHSLKYTNIENQVMWELFHSLYNISKNIIAYLSGDRAQTSKVIAYCRSILCHPSLYQTSKTDKKDNEKINIYLLDCPSSELRPIWYIAIAVQRIIDAWINALIVPSGYSERFQVKFPFQCKGQLRGISHIQFLSVLLNFAMSATELDIGYKTYFAMLSFDVTLLMRHSINENDLDAMFCLINETLATHEGIVPTSECNLTYHQILDGTQHIHKAGPIRGWWALAGERAMGIIKRFLTRGGTSYEKTLFERYNRYEQIMILTSYNWDIANLEAEQKTTNKVRSELLREDLFRSVQLHDKSLALAFSDQRIKVHKILIIPNGQYHLTEDEQEELFHTFMGYIEKHSSCLKDALLKSSFYRIRYIYMTQISGKLTNFNSNVKISFMSWISVMCNNINSNQPFPGILFAANDFPHNDDNIVNSLHNGKFFMSDYESLQALNSCLLESAFFSEAIIFGNKFKGRGFQCKETETNNNINNNNNNNNKPNELRYESRYGSEDKNTRYWPNNNKNILRNNWYEKKHSGSWSKFRLNEFKYNPIKSRNYGCEIYDDDNNFIYAQLNFFIQITFPFDKILHGITLASVTCRRHIKHERVNYIIGDDDGDSFLPHILFVPLIDMFSSPILVGAFHSPNVYKNKSKLLPLRPEKSNSNSGAPAKPNKITNLRFSNKNIPLQQPIQSIETFENKCLSRIKEMQNDRLVFHLTNNDRVDNVEYANGTNNRNELNGKLSYITLLDMEPHRNNIKYKISKHKKLHNQIFKPHSSTKIVLLKNL